MSQSVYVVSDAAGVVEVFARQADAQRYAADRLGSGITSHVLRRSVEEAVVVFDRHVVVADGRMRSDRTTQVRHFADDVYAVPDADVEWFRDDNADEWHIAGFGTDQSRLERTLLEVVDRVRRLSACR